LGCRGGIYREHPSGNGRQHIRAQVLHRQCHGELRQLISDLRPSQLDDLGLIAALQWYIRIQRCHSDRYGEKTRPTTEYEASSDWTGSDQRCQTRQATRAGVGSNTLQVCLEEYDAAGLTHEGIGRSLKWLGLLNSSAPGWGGHYKSTRSRQGTASALSTMAMEERCQNTLAAG
jgi:hypothetical protein